jgi:prepilin-type N-terminal cleavage/methylation domain-containing protein
MTSILRSKNNKFRGTRDFRGGFTIVELLVAAAITLVVFNASNL